MVGNLARACADTALSRPHGILARTMHMSCSHPSFVPHKGRISGRELMHVLVIIRRAASAGIHICPAFVGEMDPTGRRCSTRFVRRPVMFLPLYAALICSLMTAQLSRYWCHENAGGARARHRFVLSTMPREDGLRGKPIRRVGRRVMGTWCG